ncbi:MAG: Ig-like domain-containing protein [Gammaproteobacteria bacterium]|nr:Ig-like domain-containing protein [Gammaproteobacteria bacterium]
MKRGRSPSSSWPRRSDALGRDDAALSLLSAAPALLLGALLAAMFFAACGDGATEPPTPDPSRPTTVTVTPATAELTAVGATVQLNVEVLDQNGQAMAGTTVIWASSATAVATVDRNGLVTAVGNGPATITATAGAASGSTRVTVLAPAPTTIRLGEESIGAPEGGLVVVPVTASTPTESPLTVRYTIASDSDPRTDDADGADYRDLGRGVVELAPGDSVTTIRVAINQDGEIEPARELFVVVLDAPGAEAGYVLGRTQSTVVSIEEGVCDRTEVVRARILAILERQDCVSVTPEDLAPIRILDMWTAELNTRPALTLRVGDFQGLTNLRALQVSGYALSPLPADIFDGLSQLNSLRLTDNELSSLPAGIFEGLSDLRQLAISFNEMTSLPESVFAGLVQLEFINMVGFMSEDVPFALPEGLFHGLLALKELHLGSTPMPDALPEGIFRDLVNLEALNLNGCGYGVAAPSLYSHLRNLEELHLQSNGLSALPDGYFVGLTKLRKLNLLGNPGAPFELKPELERTDAATAYAPGPATVQTKLAKGAPFAFSGSVSVINGSASASAASVAAGDSIAGSFVVNAASAGTSTYVIIDVPETPSTYQGVELKAPEPLILFAASDDRFPIAKGEIPHYVLRVGGPQATVDLAPYFDEPDGEELTYTVETDASNVGVDISGSVMTVVSRSAGATNWSVRATDPQGLYASQAMEATVLRASDPASFDMDLVFLEPGQEWQNARVREAADRWNPILVGDLPDVPVKEPGLCGNDDEVRLVLEAVDDLVVFVSFANISAPGLAGVCAIREEGGLPYTGNIFIHWDLDGESIVRSTALHEIGHALGFGTLWEGFLENPVRNEDDAGADTHFTGPLALRAFDAAGGGSWNGGSKVPVANATYSQLRSANSHWRAGPLKGELMNPWGGGVWPPYRGVLSAITVQSLADLGYMVDVSQADPYTLPDAMAAAEEYQDSTSLEAWDDVLRGPIVVTDSRGNFVRVREPSPR